MTTGGWSYPPAPFWAFPLHVEPYGYSPFPDWGRMELGLVSTVPQVYPQTRASCSAARSPGKRLEIAQDAETPCCSHSLLSGRDAAEEDTIQFLDALELVEFDPSVDPKNAWDPPEAMTNILQKHFNRSLEEGEREAILKDFPKPSCKALSTPKLDEQVKEQLKCKGKDPHFGAEKTLFKVQEQVLDVTGPLTCLWVDLPNRNARVSPEDILLLIQRALVLLGSAAHTITLERRKIAWARINPTLKSLASEEYTERDADLFGPGFLEKASKRLEVEKTLDKVATKLGPQQKCPRYDTDKSDLRSFLAKGTSAGGGSKNTRQINPQNLFEFQCLPFGLSSAPRVFTKLLKPITALLWRRGIRCILFLDDIMVMNQSR